MHKINLTRRHSELVEESDACRDRNWCVEMATCGFAVATGMTLESFATRRFPGALILGFLDKLGMTKSGVELMRNGKRIVNVMEQAK